MSTLLNNPDLRYPAVNPYQQFLLFIRSACYTFFISHITYSLKTHFKLMSHSNLPTCWDIEFLEKAWFETKFYSSTIKFWNKDTTIFVVYLIVSITTKFQVDIIHSKVDVTNEHYSCMNAMKMLYVFVLIKDDCTSDQLIFCVSRR